MENLKEVVKENIEKLYQVVYLRTGVEKNIGEYYPIKDLETLSMEGFKPDILPSDYLWFIKNYGNIDTTIEVYGVEKTVDGWKFQPYEYLYFTEDDGFPNNYIILEDLGEFQYCLNLDDGSVYEWSMNDSDGSVYRYKTFLEYLNNSIELTIETLEN